MWIETLAQTVYIWFIANNQRFYPPKALASAITCLQVISGV